VRRQARSFLFTCRGRRSDEPEVPAEIEPLRRVDAYRFELPDARIAKRPADPADSARLLILGAGAGPAVHGRFTDFPDLLRSGDVLVINETRVVRARMHGERVPGGGKAEIVLLRPADGGPFDTNAPTWNALVRPGRRLRAGAEVRFGDVGALRIVDVLDDGTRVVRFTPESTPLDELLERFGELPLPPYVGPGDDARAARYQTVFARVPGSVAAPTASLHFTPRVLEAILARGIALAPLVLDVGLGTFKPMDGRSIDDHAMHAERYAIPESTADAVNAAKRDGRRVIVAGTTALRALEASAARHGRVVAGDDETSIFISPGFAFRVADGLLTNFHLPASTLLVLVSAFAGYERIRAAYAAAIEREYRFFSFGDAMFVAREGNGTAD
jgi:S-adenosylmethionine:tRNA ribosyltransferase-isomerase